MYSRLKFVAKYKRTSEIILNSVQKDKKLRKVQKASNIETAKTLNLLEMKLTSRNASRFIKYRFYNFHNLFDSFLGIFSFASSILSLADQGQAKTKGYDFNSRDNNYLRKGHVILFPF